MKKRKTAALLALGALLTAVAWVGEKVTRRREASVTLQPPKGWDRGLDGRYTPFCEGCGTTAVCRGAGCAPAGRFFQPRR